MGLLSKLGLKPSPAITASLGGSAPPRSPEMTSLVGRFQAVMGHIKALEAGKSPKATALKLATIAAGKLSTSPKGIVAAAAALDQVEAQIEDAKLRLAETQPGKGAPVHGGPQDGKKLASEARKRLESLADRGNKAIAANPRNSNAGWLAEVVVSSEERIVELEQRGTQREIDSVRERLDWLEKSVVSFEAEAAEDTPAHGASPDGKKLAGEARKRLKSLDDRGKKAIAADPRNSNAGWLAEVVVGSEERIADLDKRGTQREIDSVRKQLDWLEASIVRFEADAKGEALPEDAPADVGKAADEARKRLKSLDDRGKKAIAADPGNSNGKWLAGVVTDFEGRIVELQQRKTQRDVDDMRKQLDWLEESVVSFEADAKRQAPMPADKPAAEDSPGLKKVKAQFKHVMAELKKLAEAKIPEADALKQAAVAAGNLATSPKGIEKARLALDKVTSDAAKAKADAGKAKADADKAATDAATAAAETFDLTVGGRKLAGVHREEAMQALRLEEGKLRADLESGWAYHVDQMNLPSEVPFQAWLTTGVDAIKSFVKGKDAAKIPDLNIWDPAREMMNEVKKAERKGDVKAIAALLPKIAAAIPQARAKVGKYDAQMDDSAQTGVDTGRFVEDTSASAIGAIAEKRGGKAGKIAAQAAAQGVFQGVEQLTEWMIGTRQHADPGAIAKKMGEEAIGAIFKELVAGQLKGLFKSAFGSYLDKSVSDASLKAMGLGRDAFMTAGQKYFAEFAAKQGAGLIKSAIGRLIGGKMPSSPEAMVDAIAADLMKGSAKQLIVDGIKEIAKAAVSK